MNTNTTRKHPFEILKEKGLFVPVIAAGIALFLGLLIGIGIGGGGSDNAVAAKAVPAATVTVSAEPAPAVTETTTSVPQECLDALDTADRGFTLAADLTGEFSSAISAIQASDYSAASDSVDNIKSINVSLGNLSPSYNSDKAACRAAAQ